MQTSNSEEKTKGNPRPLSEVESYFEEQNKAMNLINVSLEELSGSLESMRMRLSPYLRNTDDGKDSKELEEAVNPPATDMGRKMEQIISTLLQYNKQIRNLKYFADDLQMRFEG